ncbi:phosphatase PAP2 family protein [Levilactobacillus zymae]|uniref:phosphatase PAP2 family protein n=1 Tax=Levilactobacillus zymae TaxID=267363 RepID=UPI003FCEDAA7
MMMRKKQRFGAALATVLVLLPMMTPVAQAKTISPVDQLIAPHEASYGFYVDNYKANTKQNTTPSTNPAYGLLNNFSKYWSPVKGQLDPAFLNQNTAIAAKITQNRTSAEVTRSFLTDRRSLSYSLISGLGPYAKAFIKNANAQTDYTTVPTEPQPATTPYSKVKWADPNSKLGDMVKLVELTRGSYGSTGVPKNTFKYKRPYKLSKDVLPNPYLVNVMAASPKDGDFDFPSGHTTAGFETGEMLAYAFPERFQELVTRSSEMGYDRILAGRHSPLAVMGGRMFGTAVTASVLNDPANRDIMKKAYQEAHSNLLQSSPLVNAQDDYSNYQENQKNYRYRMTYGLPQDGDSNQAMRVPKGAEVLLETRLPYLSANQRRAVLATTGLPSGYHLLDDAEGWGRLDLFSAANGYGQLWDTTKVNMDATKGSFNAHDTWRNNIGGTGQLVKQGSGDLTLNGNNTFKGGIQVTNGQLDLNATNAAGQGNVAVKGGTLTTNTAAKLQKGYQQSKRGTLALTVTKATAMKIRGQAKLAGTLTITNAKSLESHQVLLKFGSVKGKFAHVKGLPQGWHVKYHAHSLELVRG